ncbi:MAG: tRNA (adenosine(37)-N6)-dimethylallyltransferase MiaA [Planctomycetes bacterium]|nr:tRNA (adenosine(37)-N6)-dimethylallyltransferase MiaA [Planctomycetota bacterium]
MQLPTQLLKKCWFIAGPTACGKTATSLELADQLSAEIISLDSMTIYRGMDIGTAKPDAGQRNRVPHHLIDILDPHEEFSLADYIQAAAKSAENIVSRGKTPLFVGGTGLYLRGVLRGVFPGPAANWELRRELEALAAQQGDAAVHARLTQIDPVLASRLAPGDLRRVIRGIEVYELTGSRLSDQQLQAPLPEDLQSRHVFWLHPPRDWLHEQINQRVNTMLEKGLIPEVQTLLQLQHPLGKTARQALGYKEVIEGLASGQSLAEMAKVIQIRTRQFAKRQHTWFRNLVECREIAMNGTETPSVLADRILDQAR